MGMNYFLDPVLFPGRISPENGAVISPIGKSLIFLASSGWCPYHDKGMYPYLRLFRLLVNAKRRESLSLGDTSVLQMRVFLGDMDIYPELNNGRHLTMMDLGRMDLAQRTGLLRVVHEQKWGFAVSGASVRFRHRLKALKPFLLHTRVVAIDDRWFYFHQYTVRKGKIHSSALVRAGVTSKQGLVPVKKVLERLGMPDWNPGMPDWIRAWSEAEKLRPWDNEIEDAQH